MDYVEPSSIYWRPLDSCGSEALYTGSDNVQVPTPGYNLGYDIAPLQYIQQYVNGAWAYSTGAGHTVGLTDTGVDLTYGTAAEWSSSNFSSGLSSGRPPFYQVFPTSSPGCSHGSRSAGIIAAPRNGRSSVGVAYRAGLVSGFTANDVVAPSGGWWAIREVVTQGARTVSMPWGFVVWSDAVADEIRYWRALADVLFIGAAGTTNWGALNQNVVFFPASMPEVFAVSGAELANPGVRPPDVHYGTALDAIAFTNSLTTGRGVYSGSQQLTKLGGSSGATALATGIAALVRARYPTQSESWVRNRLVSTGGLACGALSSWHVLLNAEAAVGGLCAYAGRPSGVNQIVFDRVAAGDTRTSTTEEYCMIASGGVGPLTISWPVALPGSSGSGPYCRRFTFSRGTYVATVRANMRDAGTPGAIERSYSTTVQVVDMDNNPGCPTCVRPLGPAVGVEGQRSLPRRRVSAP